MKELYDLYFNNPKEDGKIIDTLIMNGSKENFYQDIFNIIKEYVKENYPNFKIYYYRIFEHESQIIIDYGSHINFFYLIKQGE